MSVILEDGTVCDITSVNTTAIYCTTEPFSTTESTGLSLTVNLNGLTDQSLSVTVQPGPVVVTSINPASTSPVLAAIITLTVANFTETLVPSDLSVKLVSKKNPSIVRYENVVETGLADNGEQYLKIKFGGSESGNYSVFVRSLSYGNFDATSLNLQLIGTVIDFNPKQGSIYGGTLVTITGYWFSSDPTNNPVRIGYHDCLVEESSESQIKCRTTATGGS